MQDPSSSLHMCLMAKGMGSNVSDDESDTTSLDDRVELVHEQKGMLKKQANLYIMKLVSKLGHQIDPRHWIFQSVRFGLTWIERPSLRHVQPICILSFLQLCPRLSEQNRSRRFTKGRGRPLYQAEVTQAGGLYAAISSTRQLAQITCARVLLPKSPKSPSSPEPHRTQPRRHPGWSQSPDSNPRRKSRRRMKRRAARLGEKEGEKKLDAAMAKWCEPSHVRGRSMAARASQPIRPLVQILPKP
jgi:hypothetical protein